MKRFINTLSFTLLCLSCLLIGACSSLSGPHAPLLAATDYLQMAANTAGPEQQDYLLLAAERYVQARQGNAALTILHRPVLQQLSPEQTAQRQLLMAQSYLQNHQQNEAYQALTPLLQPSITLTQPQAITLHQVLANLYLTQNNLVAGLQQLSLVRGLSNDSDSEQSLLQQMWQTVQSASIPTINRALKQSPPANIAAWLQLALIMNQSNQNPQQLAMQLNQWKQQHPDHPAIALLPSDLLNQAQQPLNAPKHIALLLPITGSLAAQATAIKNGFFSAYYYWQQQDPQQSPTVTVYDTSDKDTADTVYQQAVNAGADVVIGPLTKQNVNEVANDSNISVPTIALNAPTNLLQQPIQNLYLFGLSPNDEAIQVAQRMWEQHYGKVIIITPDTPWGAQIANTFQQNWTNYGGQVIAQLNYSLNHSAITNQVKNLLTIQLSDQRARKLRSVIYKKFRFLPYRRKDFDSIFLIAQPGFARQITPLLKFYFAGNIPTFAISQVYAGQNNVQHDRDLDGLIFCDMPWVLTPKLLHPLYLNQLHKTVTHLWPYSFKQDPKLYALGIDAFDITRQLNHLNLWQQFGFSAATGTLYLNQNHFFRKLSFAQFKRGKIEVLP